MNLRLNKSITLLELIIAMVILGFVVAGLYSIEIFSRAQLTAVDRRSRLQAEASYLLEHMAKNINQAIGDFNNAAVSNTTLDGDQAVTIWIDLNQNGKRDPAPLDRQIGYSYRGTPDFQARYYFDATPGLYEVISQRIFNLTWSATDNFLFVNATACWNPANPSDSRCGTPNNPAVTMQNRIDMPAVSTN
jgi:type II secretory pathway pseudopilin PulG